MDEKYGNILLDQLEMRSKVSRHGALSVMRC